MAVPFNVSRNVFQKHQFFINYHINDTQKLATYISNILDFKGLTGTEVADTGNHITREIENAISNASFHIVILSMNYALSPRCLMELSCVVRSGTPIIPIFYHVHPLDLPCLAQGKGIYAKAFSEHACTYPQQKLEEWKTALYKLSCYPGYTLQHNDEMRKVMKSIVNSVIKPMKEVQKMVARNPVQVSEDLAGKFRNSRKRLLGQLYGKSERHCGNQFQKLARILPREDSRPSLKTGHDQLIQEAVSDIACFLIGEKKSVVIALWDGSGWSREHLLETLVNSGYAELDHQNRIRMHDDLRDMVRDVAAKYPPYRLWLPGQITSIQTRSQKMPLTRGIMAATTQFASCPAHKEFPKCSSHYQPPFQECMELVRNSWMEWSLRLLVVTGNDFTEEFAPLSKGLVWLRWFNFKHTHLPAWLSLKELRVLELYDASGLNEMWKDHEQPPLQLRELTITATWGSSLERFPSSICRLKHLKKIALIGYLGEEFSIKTLPEEFCDLQSLEHLELRFCKVLSSLPIRFGELTNLLHIDLCSCEKLGMSPDSFKQLKYLRYLDLSGCRNLSVKSDILENMSKLQKLCFSRCRKLLELPLQITNQASLRELNVEDTNLRNIPNTIGQLSNLETLRIGSPQLTSLPDSLGFLSSLSSLFITDCCSLGSLPESLGRLNELQILSLENLPEVMSLPGGLWQLGNLQSLEISGCPIEQFDFFSGSSSLIRLELIKLIDTLLTRLSISENCCPRLETLILRHNDQLMEIEFLPKNVIVELTDCRMLNNMKCIRGLLELQHFEIIDCPGLDELC